MAKTIYPHDFYAIQYGYAVNTTVVTAALLYNTAQPPAPIGAQVVPASMAGIGVNQLLTIGGVEVTVSSVSATSFTYSLLYVPTAGTGIRTPWKTIDSLRYTKAPNYFTFSYYAPAAHDLYFGALQTPDSGSIVVSLDGQSLGSFDLFNPTNAFSEIALAEDVSAGEHSVSITAALSDPAQQFVYFQKLELAEHVPQTGGVYSFLGPAGTLEDSTNNFIGDWSHSGSYAFTSTPGASVFFYPQMDTDGQIRVRLQKTPDSGIISVLLNGVEVQQLDLYADPGLNPVEITLLTQPPENPGQYEIELRLTGTANPASTGSMFYFRESVVMFARTDLQALTLSANYLLQVANRFGDGAFADAHDSSRVNFDATSLYGCMGLLAAYEVLGDPEYLTAVRNFLIWFAQMQMQSASDPFTDGAWNIGYQRIPGPTPAYTAAIAPYDALGITEIRWVDAVQALPAFILYWYSKLANDSETRTSLLPVFKRGLDGFIRNNYDPESGFFFSSWQQKSAPTIFLYHDSVERRDTSGALLEQHNDSEVHFFSFSPAVAWSTYAPENALGSDEHYSLAQSAYVAFSLTLNAGDQVYWITQTAWDVGIAEIQVSADGTTFTHFGNVDCYSATVSFRQSFLIYTAASAGTYWIRIRHTGTINPRGATATGWQRLPARYSAGQTDVALGLLAMWTMTRKRRYAALAARLIRRFDSRYWLNTGDRWAIALEGPAPGSASASWYPFPHGYTCFGQGGSRLFQPRAHFREALDSLAEYMDEEGGFKPPGFLEAEHIFSAFYLLGQNTLGGTPPQAYELAKQFVKSGQYFLSLNGELVAGVTFSKRYPYLYCNIAGFVCLALAGALSPTAGRNPILQQPNLSHSELWMQPS